MSDILFNASSLPVSKSLHSLLSKSLIEKLAEEEHIATSTYLLFNLRDSSYSAEAGGFHPVEIAIAQSSDGRWNIEYTTDSAKNVNCLYAHRSRDCRHQISDRAYLWALPFGLALPLTYSPF
nr:DUF2787 family protein [Vibrio hepatarius]